MLPQPKFPASPARFIGRHIQIDSFRHALAEGISVGRTSSFAVLGDWGVGKSSLLLKFASICSEPSYGMLAVLVSVSTDLHNYLGLAESLLDKLSETLATTNSTGANLRLEVLNWKLKRVNIGGFELDREAPHFFLRSGSTLLSNHFSVACLYSYPFNWALLRDNSRARQLRVFCFHGSSWVPPQKWPLPSFYRSSDKSVPGPPASPVKGISLRSDKRKLRAPHRYSGANRRSAEAFLLVRGYFPDAVCTGKDCLYGAGPRDDACITPGDVTQFQCIDPANPSGGLELNARLPRTSEQTIEKSAVLQCEIPSSALNQTHVSL